MMYTWKDAKEKKSHGYRCGYCSEQVSSSKGFQSVNNSQAINGHIYICTVCGRPSFFPSRGQGSQVPGSLIGDKVSIQDNSVQKIYDEARQAASVESYTAVVLCCRKLLMHIGVSKGADENKNFVHYVDYLFSNHYLPPDAKDWVDHIRTKGNEANHEIVIMKKEDAEDLITFCEMLLKTLYEFPAILQQRTKAP